MYRAPYRGPAWLLPHVPHDWLLWSRVTEPRVGQSDSLSLELRIGGGGGIPKGRGSQMQVYSLIASRSPGGASERQSFWVHSTKIDSEIQCGA